MRDRTIRTAAAFAVLFGSTSLVLTAAAPAFADASKILPVASTGDVVVDGVHQRIYISDPRNAKIVATNYDGTVVGTRSNLPGVLGLALSADSEQLYGAVNGADAIVSIATKTFTETAQYATGKDTTPHSSPSPAARSGSATRGTVPAEAGPATVRRRATSARWT